MLLGKVAAPRLAAVAIPQRSLLRVTVTAIFVEVV